MTSGVIGPEDMRAVLALTDALGIHREAVRVPLEKVAHGSARIEKGVLHLELPAAGDREAWLETQRARIPEIQGFDTLRRQDD